jgi:hypothetical protein
MWAVLQSNGGPIVSWDVAIADRETWKKFIAESARHLALRNESRIDSYRWSRFWSHCES